MGFTDDLETDLDQVFLNKDEFAEEITITPDSSGPPFTTNAIFDREHEEIDPDTGVPVISEKPVVRIQEKDLPFPIEEDDEATVRTIVYKIIDIRPDGVGTTKLFLHIKD